MRTFLIVNFVILSLSSLHKANAQKIKTTAGEWTGLLYLNSNESLPFKFNVENIKGKKDHYSFSIENGEEKILLESKYSDSDSLLLEFPAFHSYLKLKAHGKKLYQGYWQNLNKGNNYKIPCIIQFGYSHRFSNKYLDLNNYALDSFSGNWETTFDPGTENEYKAIGIFKQSKFKLNGTFLTETGDFRYLDGNVSRDSLFLSCFDGSHAFLFTGKIKGGTIQGKFYSGKHMKSDWIGVKNNSFKLRDPDSLTYVSKQEGIKFILKDVFTGNDFIFPNEKFNNKVTIIQIMGTWCPNCMDESRYFKELSTKYKKEGLEIISVCYETGTDESFQLERIKTLQARLNTDFTYVLGGTANKGLASQHFNMLNEIISFPTAIFIGRDGSVRKVHTGFNGPGTGNYYEDYSKETEEFVKTLLQEK